VDPVTRKNKGYAFVGFLSCNDSKQALVEMQGFHLNGRSLKLNSSFEKRTLFANHVKTNNSSTERSR
jgi:RNA recognition motif-containing protein